MKKIISLFMSVILLASVLVTALPAQAAELPAPYHVSAIKVSDSSARICWPRVNDAKSYKVYRSVKKSSGYKLVKTTKSFNFVDKGLKYSTVYYYKVKAVAGNKESRFSPVKAFKLSDMKTGVLSGTYHVTVDPKGMDYNPDTKVYTVKGYSCYPCTVSKEKIRKNKGKKFQIKCTKAAKGYYLFTLKANKKGTFAKIVGAKYRDTAHGKTYRNDAEEFYLEKNKGCYEIRYAGGVPVNDYATKRALTIYIRANDYVMNFDGFDFEEEPSYTTGHALFSEINANIAEGYNDTIKVTVSDGYATYINTNPYIVG